ncbi:MAG: DEAD/DEAH box helicase [Kiritimatiellaeota bacterium]|nr:DEAD/DEAH box helicase [Kiritimatiellota bacterium]
MPLTFLKKLAGKLLNKKPAADKPAKGAPAKKDARGQQARSANAKPDRSPGSKQGKDNWKTRSQRAGDRPQQNQKGQRPRNERRPARGELRHSAPPASPDGGRVSPPVTAPGDTRPLQKGGGGRSIARPEASRRGGGGRGRDRRGGPRPANTAANVRRPGGVVAPEEQEKRHAEHAAWDIGHYQVEPAEGKMRFHDLNLPTEILHAIADLSFQYCTPVQALSLEHALAGKNVAGRAQTGTGKTAAFLVAILTRYLRSPEARHQDGGIPRALVIAPTRELVIQICKDADNLGKYCALRSLAVYGGMDYDRQKRELQDAPVDLLVATPGRLLDFVRSRVIDLSKVDTLVVDEADRMLDMGFIPDVRAILSRLPPKDKRCTMLYSATLTDDVMRLAAQWMEAPVRVEVESDQVPTETIKQIVYVVTAREKFTVLFNHIQQYPDSRILVFCNRRTTTDDVAVSLSRRGIKCDTLSGDVSQNRRLQILEDFREGKCRVVIATDVAGRGLHVDNIGFVINFDFPYEAEDYVHRIGRTGRAGQSGVAISFADEDESFSIPNIEKLLGEELKCTVLKGDAPLLAALPEPRRRVDSPPPGRGEHPVNPRQAPRDEKPADSKVNAVGEDPRVRPGAHTGAPLQPTPPAAQTQSPPLEKKTATVPSPPPSPPLRSRSAGQRPSPAPVKTKRPDPPRRERHRPDYRRHQEPPPTNVHKLPPPGAKFSEEGIPGGIN